MSRGTIAAGAAPNNKENLRLWIRNSDAKDQERAGALLWVWVTFVYLIPAVFITLQILSPSDRKSKATPEDRPSGVKTFLENQDGTTREKDFGSQTNSSSTKSTSTPPGSSWKLVE